MSRLAPDGGTAAIGREEYDDGLTVCPDCGEEVTDAELNVEAYERFGKMLCEPCFEGRCEALEDDEYPAPDWSDLEDDIADAISDSMDMDWSSRDGAKAVVAVLMKLGVRQ